MKSDRLIGILELFDAYQDHESYNVPILGFAGLQLLSIPVLIIDEFLVQVSPVLSAKRHAYIKFIKKRKK